MQPQAFNSARFDAFDLWSAARRSARMGSAASAQYLPSDLQMYGGTLDRSGAWQYEAPYGYVWYPTVDQDWRPYYDGYWSSIRPYGWTWIGFDVWAWPTHHYGRWGLAQNRWFWIPERHWNAAWVSWGAAPGYVSWCPLGFNNRPVLGLSLTTGNSWAGWVVVPRTHFGWSNVRQWAIAPHRLPATTPLVVQASAPVPPPMRSIPHPNVVASSSGGRVAAPRAAAGGGIHSAAGIRQPGAGSQQFVAGSQQPGAASQPPAAGIRQPGSASQQFAAGNRQPVAGSRQLPVGSQQPQSDSLLPAARHQFQADRSRPSAIPRQPTAIEGPAPASSSAPVPQPTAPTQPAQTVGARPRTAVPRTESSSSSRAPARSDPAPQGESGPPPAARPAPASPAPATAVPRDGPPAAASGASPRSSSGAGAGGAAPGRGARHP
jgi:hypothetical protein